MIDVAPPKRRDPAEPDRRVSPYSVTKTGPSVSGCWGFGSCPHSHQQTDKASPNAWFEQEHCNACNAHLK